MSYRIIGGTHRHRLIKSPVNPETRATKDMVREAVFSSLGSKVNGAVVLDLFAGTGAMGFEALSRGAREVHFNDRQKICIDNIRKNCVEFGFGNVGMTDQDYESALRSYADKKIIFDIVFLDPPYNAIPVQKAVDLLFSGHLLADDAVIIGEAEEEIKANEEKFSKIKKYKYGRTHISAMWR